MCTGANKRPKKCKHHAVFVRHFRTREAKCLALYSINRFILLKGEVKLVGNDKNRARRISADSPYPFFGLAEILAKHDEVDVEQYEHRSAVAMKDCDLARVSRDDFDDMINKFPDVHTDLKAIAQVREQK